MEDTNNTINLEPFKYAEEAKKAVEPDPVDLGHDVLLPVLYFIWDAFNRAAMDFFAVRQTAKAIIGKDQLSGDSIEIGIRRNEWISDNKDLFDIFMENEGILPENETPEGVTYMKNGVAINLHVYEDNPCVTNLVPVQYEYEKFNVPNRFDRFCAEFDNQQQQTD